MYYSGLPDFIACTRQANSCQVSNLSVATTLASVINLQKIGKHIYAKSRSESSAKHESFSFDLNT